jgi:DNA-binding transcriptional LysR family regulator
MLLISFQIAAFLASLTGGPMKHLRILHYVDAVARSGSIRKAAEHLNVTSSAVNRRIMDLEEELGSPLFERRPRGMRLTAAGEVFVRHLRDQLGDVERMKSQVEALKGLRRGTVRIACSQALAHDVLPSQVAAFRRTYPQITFQVTVTDHDHAVAALISYDVDLVLVFRPSTVADLRLLLELPQRMVALLPAEHPLAGRQRLRLRDCVQYPMALPDRALGGRQLLEDYAAHAGLSFDVGAESNSFEFLRGCVQRAGLISFQIEIGAPADSDRSAIVVRPVDSRDMPRANLVLAQLRRRSLPLAAAQFAEHLRQALPGRYTA